MGSANSYDGRLDRIEEQLGQVSDAIVLLARIDERMLSHVEQQKRLTDKQEELEIRVGKLEVSRGKVLGAFAVLSALGSIVGFFINFFIG